MKKTLLTLAVAISLGACANRQQQAALSNVEPTRSENETTNPQQMKTFHDFTVTDIEGKEVSLSQFAGKKVLVVNVASKCGLTPQYADLQSLYDQYASSGFVIVGFPANNFGAQEPGTNEEILSFCTSSYEVSFPMMAKISVKGDDQHELYQWLTQKSQNGVLDAEVTWNFQKFMIDEQGHLVDFAGPRTEPFDDKIVNWIKG